MTTEKKQKKWYQKWWIWVIGVIFLMITWNRISNFISEVTTKEIPNVMGVNYIDAVNVLENEGFKVMEIETDAESIMNSSIYNRSVKKGEVFKVNDETSPNYYSTTKDKKITIYYAKEDYIYDEPKEPEVTSEETVEDDESTDVSKEQEHSSETTNDSWRQFLIDYEEWVDEYVAFMKKYTENPNDLSLLADYSKFMGETVEWSQKVENVEVELENDPAALQEYLEVLSRITAKLAGIAY